MGAYLMHYTEKPLIVKTAYGDEATRTFVGVKPELEKNQSP